MNSILVSIEQMLAVWRDHGIEQRILRCIGGELPWLHLWPGSRLTVEREPDDQ